MPIPGSGIASQIVIRLGARQKRVRGRRIRGTIPELVWQSLGMRGVVGPTREKNHRSAVPTRLVQADGWPAACQVLIPLEPGPHARGCWAVDAILGLA